MKQMHDIGLSDVVNVMNAKGYTVNNDFRPNIVGIRNATRESNSYDDICWVWWTEMGKQIVHNYTITTNPGYHYLKNPIAGTDGTAILVPGQYSGIWTLGMHRGKQFALVQHGAPVSVYRDANKDTVLDYDPKTIVNGWFGIDGHFGSLGDTDVVDRFSAGCQVWRYHEAHQELMQDLKTLTETYKFSKFGYTLLQQEDFV